jgi:type I restriction enzyme R subunit
VSHFTESVVEEAALGWLGELGYTIRHGQEIAPDTPTAERADYSQVVLHGRLRDTLLSKLLSGEIRVPIG